jgi:hypothetical protein
MKAKNARLVVLISDSCAQVLTQPRGDMAMMIKHVGRVEICR